MTELVKHDTFKSGQCKKKCLACAHRNRLAIREQVATIVQAKASEEKNKKMTTILSKAEQIKNNLKTIKPSDEDNATINELMDKIIFIQSQAKTPSQ